MIFITRFIHLLFQGYKVFFKFNRISNFRFPESFFQTPIYDIIKQLGFTMVFGKYVDYSLLPITPIRFRYRNVIVIFLN
jgi:hypothetical protein